MSSLRSSEWFGKKDKMGFIYRSWMKNQGFPEDLFDGADLDFLVGKSGDKVARDSH